MNLQKHYSVLGIEDLVCSLSWSKRLKEENVKQHTIFTWFVDEISGYAFIVGPNSIVDSEKKYPERYAAFTVTEFDKMFPQVYRIARSKDHWKLGFEGPNDQLVHIDLPNEINMANVYAKMLLSIIKNKQKTIGHKF